MNAPALRLHAPAKVNLYLAVGDRRPDGFHDVTTVLAALDLADEITMLPAGELSVTTEPDLGIPAEDNLAHRAARDLGAAVGRKPHAAIRVRKAIPHGAGLGGGSSDGAAVLAGLATWWDLAVDDPRVLEVARGLGADVAFFLRGGTALFDGRGDRFVRALPFVELPVVIVRPDQPVPTGAAYAAFDRHLRVAPPGPEPLTEALSSGDPQAVAAELFNNMTDASCGLVAEVADALAWLRTRPGVLGSAMAGSGSAVFGVCESHDAAARVARDTAPGGWWSAATRTAAGGVRVMDEGSGA